MEHIHSLDVSWMTHGNPKDRPVRPLLGRQRSLSNPAPLDSPTPAATTNGHGRNDSTQAAQGTPNVAPSPNRPALGTRTSSDEKRIPQPAVPHPPQRRGSWFSNISQKFSSSNGATQSPPVANTASPKPAEFSVPKANPAKQAVLQHAAKPEGEGPYTPAPPRGSQTNGLLHVFRRLSSSTSSGSLNPTFKAHNHGLVERQVLNVDRNRERCAISGLNQAKLRRVAFCVDVEIAPMPKYIDEMDERKAKDKAAKEMKKKLKEKGEAEALKNLKAVECQKEVDGSIKATGEEVPKEPATEGTSSTPRLCTSPAAASPIPISSAASASDARKKEKKKKSEEDRKARKERKRRQAEANGTVPMELYYNSDSDSSTSANGGSYRPETPAGLANPPQTMPTTNPVRIYRRCCQLRETHILKKITEQLMDPANFSAETGMVEKLDLTGYYMALPDLVTLGDYLAVVPVRELILVDCSLADEGLRVILAGLLAARKTKVPSPLKRRRQLQLQQQKSSTGTVDGLIEQGGVVERLVLSNNRIGPEGWRHICLFIYLCRTLKVLDLSGIQFPRHVCVPLPDGQQPPPQALCSLFAKSLGERLGGSTLTLLSMAQTGLSTPQLAAVIDGAIKCGIKRLNLAHNDIDSEGLAHVARFLKSNQCEGLDLGGNDLRDKLGILADSLEVETCPLWALSLADCNLEPSSLCKLFPTLVKLDHLRFIDLSHNHELFSSDPSAVAVLRRYLPKFACLKRIHLADCTLSAEQAIALAEILPEVTGLAHISFLQNKDLVELTTSANSEEKQEEACALFASLLAAARVSTSLVAVDIEVPSEQSSDLVKAMAKQVVAYGLRNMELATALQTATSATTPAPTAEEGLLSGSFKAEPEYPDVLQRLVGHDVMLSLDADADVDAAPDNDYVIGGTGVVKALACCLKNRGDDISSHSVPELLAGEVDQVSLGDGEKEPTTAVAKAKDTSKHLLLSARKIRLRLQPAIVKAKMAANDSHNYHRLMFLDNTLHGIIKRFEDEFPDTRLSAADDSGVDTASTTAGNDKGDAASFSSLDNANGKSSSLASGPTPPLPTDSDLSANYTAAIISDAEDDAVAQSRESRKALSRSNSIISLSSKALADEEARVLRAGHKFRAGIVALRPEHYNAALLSSGVEEVGADPNHARLLHELLDEMGDADLKKEAEERGVVQVFQERRRDILKRLREADPQHWDSFVESQVMARKNVGLPEPEERKIKEQGVIDEEAIED
ncbi:Microtubules assembly and stabilization protein [Podospora pseudopauciseta]|uniref:Microtubules assembly and stabilization protein n=1 Tax=Podospora pseudopauciseta TaxID=2093780 RepID=A0ABR0HRJ8_9PEZI|nr:Microtubules assembly and stabilization protein [Podospora pseudopauciseta]